MHEINRHQLDLLKGFYAHLYCVYHHGAKSDFGFYAELLDNTNVPWSVQNTVAVLAEDKASQSKYLTTLLTQKNIHVKQCELTAA
jgi:hypothetical protein